MSMHALSNFPAFVFFVAVGASVITTSPSCSIARSIALCRAWLAAFSSFLAFLLDTGAKGPLVGYRTLLFAVPRGFLEILFFEFFFWTFFRDATLRDLFGTLGLPLDGILKVSFEDSRN